MFAGNAAITAPATEYYQCFRAIDRTAGRALAAICKETRRPPLDACERDSNRRSGSEKRGDARYCDVRCGICHRVGPVSRGSTPEYVERDARGVRRDRARRVARRSWDGELLGRRDAGGRPSRRFALANPASQRYAISCHIDKVQGMLGLTSPPRNAGRALDGLSSRPPDGLLLRGQGAPQYFTLDFP